MKNLIIGASGFLGRNIAQGALEHGWSVSGTFIQHPENIPPGCRPIPFGKVASLRNHYDVVFLSIGNFTMGHQALLDVNVVIPMRMAEKFRAAKIVFISSVAVYGNCQQIIDENSPFDHPNVYGLSKIAGEFIVKAHKKFSIIRLVNLYGRGMEQRSFIPTIINQALQKHIITLRGNGRRKNEYLHVDDAARLCLTAAAIKENDTYLGASGKSVSNLQIAKIVQRCVSCSIEFSGRELSHSLSFDPNATMKKIRWSPKIDLKTGLSDLIQFYENSNI